MRNQFIYTFKDGEKTSTASFNVEKVIRAATQFNGEVVVILDDFNERVFEEDDIKNGKKVGKKNVRQTVQSEVRLSPEDGERFFLETNIMEPGKSIHIDMKELRKLTEPMGPVVDEIKN